MQNPCKLIFDDLFQSKYSGTACLRGKYGYDASEMLIKLIKLKQWLFVFCDTV